jgi:hypothetical protein
VKAYRLVLSCELAGEGIELITPLPVPGKGEPRHEFLQELNRVRSLGSQIAKLFHVPYWESGEAPAAPAQLPDPVPAVPR